MRYTDSIIHLTHILGLTLGLNEIELQVIKVDSRPTSHDQHLAIVTKWLVKGSASWAALVSALRDPLIGRNDIADQIARDHPKGKHIIIMITVEPL